MRASAVMTLVAAAGVLVGAQSASKQIIPNRNNPSLPFSAAIRAGNFIYVAGAIGNSSTPLAKGDVAAQTRQTLDGIAATLKQAGSSLANAVSVTVYLRNVSDFAAMNQAYAPYFPSNPPARTTVAVTQPLANPDGLLEISVIAVPDGAERQVMHPAGWAKPANPYSYGIKSGDTLFLAGLVSRNPRDNTPITGDVTTQTKAVIDNAEAILAAAGMSLSDVVASRVYLTDPGTFQTMNAAYRPRFGAIAPARLTVQAGLTAPDLAVEIAMTAVKDPARMAFTTPNADGSPGQPSANLSSAIRVGNRLYVSGLVGNTPATRGSVEAQSAEILARLGRTLAAAGFSFANVVDTTVFMSDMSRFGEMNNVYVKSFTNDFPARATVGLPPMGGGETLVEMMFVAVK